MRASIRTLALFSALYVVSSNTDVPKNSPGFQLTPPENVWTRLGENATMRCKADRAIRSCAWITPYGKNYVLEEGLKAEGGRIAYLPGAEGECGIFIGSIKEDDLGKWSCNIGIVENDEIISATGRASLSIATTPTNVAVYDSVLIKSLNNSSNSTFPYENVTCLVENASPKPDFSWYLNGAPVGAVISVLDESFDDNNTYTQIIGNISSVLDGVSGNVTLTCSVTHMGLKESINATMEITVQDELIETKPETRKKEEKHYPKLEILIFMVILVSLFVFALVVVLILRRHNKLPICADVKIEEPVEPVELKEKLDTDSSTDSAVKPAIEEESSSSDHSDKTADSDAVLIDNGALKSESESVKNENGDVEISKTVDKFLSKFNFNKNREKDAASKLKNKTSGNDS